MEGDCVKGLIIIWIIIIIKGIQVCYFIIVQRKNQSKEMDLGTTLAVFVLVATALMLLFCLLIKYYSYKLKKQRREVVNINAMEESLYRSNQQIMEGAYDEFRERRQMTKEIEIKHMIFEEEKQIQKSEIRQILDISNNIYGITKLRKRLNNEVPPLSSETNRSNPTIKSFNISRLNTMQTQKQRAFYSYVQKLVAYNERGLTVIQTQAVSIKKENGQFKLIKGREESHIQEHLENCYEQLQVHGFYPNSFGYYKYVNSVDVTDLKDDLAIGLNCLHKDCKKEEITKEQFNNCKEEMINLTH